jgi:hypothetical protein
VKYLKNMEKKIDVVGGQAIINLNPDLPAGLKCLKVSYASTDKTVTQNTAWQML